MQDTRVSMSNLATTPGTTRARSTDFIVEFGTVGASGSAGAGEPDALVDRGGEEQSGATIGVADRAHLRWIHLPEIRQD